MRDLGRRQLLKGGLAAGATLAMYRSNTALAASPCDHAGSPSAALDLATVAGARGTTMSDQFLTWLFSKGLATDHGVRNMTYNFYDEHEGRGVWVYPMLTGKTMLWLIERGRVADAATIAASLLRWQQVKRDGAHARSYGAFPSKIDRAPKPAADGSPVWTSSGYYYSGDNLVILEGLVALYEKTKDAAVLNAAIGVGTWITEVMCRGLLYGMWVEDHGAPMYLVTDTGAFVNEIHTSEEMLWIGALRRLGKATAEEAYCRQADRAWAFLRNSQATTGAYFEKYDPGYPAKPYSSGRWKQYQPGQIVADSVLRCALGSCRAGEIEAARRFYKWLYVEHGAVTAFVDADTGGSGFPPGQRPYYDMTSSALHRSLCQWLGEKTQAGVDIDFLARTQLPNGAWYWGLYRGTMTPVEPQIGTIVGLWATSDLSSRIG